MMAKTTNVRLFIRPKSIQFSLFYIVFLEKDSGNHSNDLVLSDPLSFDNYRTATANDSSVRQVSNRNNPTYAGANHRLSDNEDEQNDDGRDQAVKKRDPGSMYTTSNIMPESYSRTIPSSSFVDSSVRANSNSSTMLMMMKSNENEGTIHSTTSRNGNAPYEHRTVVVSSTIRPPSSVSSSSSSSLPADEQQQQQQHTKTRGYNFVPPPFNGTRLVAKSTEQLNRSFANDSLVKYCTPPTTPNTSLIQPSVKTQSPTSILKQNYLQRYNQSSLLPNSSMFELKRTLNDSNEENNRSLGFTDDQTLDVSKDVHQEESKSEQQRYSNGVSRMSSSNFDVHRGDDFYKKLMFYEQNSSNNNNNFHQSSTNSPRRSLFQQSTTSIPSSTSRNYQSPLSRTIQQTSSRSNQNSSDLNRSNYIDRMQRSKSYKDLFDPPASSSSSSSANSAQQIYYQSQPAEIKSNLNSPTAPTPGNSNNLYPYYSSSFYYSNGNGTTTTTPTSIVGSMLSNASTNRILDSSNHSTSFNDYQRRQSSLQHSSSNNNLMADDVSSSSTVSHLPKPPPGIPGQNARYSNKHTSFSKKRELNSD